MTGATGDWSMHEAAAKASNKVDEFRPDPSPTRAELAEPAGAVEWPGRRVTDL